MQSFDLLALKLWICIAPKRMYRQLCGLEKYIVRCRRLILTIMGNLCGKLQKINESKLKVHLHTTSSVLKMNLEDKGAISEI